MRKALTTGAAGVIIVALLCIYAETCQPKSDICENCVIDVKGE